MSQTDKELLEKFGKLMQISQKVKISDAALAMRISKADLLPQLLEWGNHFSFKIDNDIIVVEDLKSLNRFLEDLDGQFNDWDTKEKLVVGKIDRRSPEEAHHMEQKKQIKAESYSYHGTMLVQPEYDAMMALEQMVGSAIPALPNVGNRTFGFCVADSHVSGLGLYNKGLDSLPESIGNLTALIVLGLSDNKLSSLPESITKMTWLKVLHIDNNGLSSLSENIGHLTALTVLSLSDNKLFSLPESIGHLTALTVLSLSDNKLFSLPESITKMTWLKVLHIGNNGLSSLPESIGNLTSLKSLDLQGNKLFSLPESIKNWIEQLKKNGCKVLQSGKKEI